MSFRSNSFISFSISFFGNFNVRRRPYFFWHFLDWFSLKRGFKLLKWAAGRTTSSAIAKSNHVLVWEIQERLLSSGACRNRRQSLGAGLASRLTNESLSVSAPLVVSWPTCNNSTTFCILLFFLPFLDDSYLTSRTMGTSLATCNNAVSIYRSSGPRDASKVFVRSLLGTKNWEGEGQD